MLECAYCGEHSTCFDHVIPRSYMAVRKRTGKEPGFKVPSCAQCNAILGAQIFKNLVERKQYVHKRLKVRLGRIASHISWDDDELATLGPNLRHCADVALSKRAVARDRLRYAVAPPEARWLRLEARWRSNHGENACDLGVFDAQPENGLFSQNAHSQGS